jgi:hypothetical protein
MITPVRKESVIVTYSGTWLVRSLVVRNANSSWTIVSVAELHSVSHEIGI